MDGKRKLSHVFDSNLHKEIKYEDDQKTDDRIMYKQILTAKLKTGKGSQITGLPRSPLKRRRSASKKKCT
jgi:hypothetical protein